MFELISFIFRLLVYQPLLNAMVFLYEFLPGNDFGIAVVTLTLSIRILLYPLNQAAIKAQKALADLQPKLEELQMRFQNKKEELAQETLRLYREAHVNPFASLLPFLVQLPILIALFQLLGRNLGKGEGISLLYPFIPKPGSINFQMFGVIDGTKPLAVFALIAGALQFIQAKMMTPSPSAQKRSDFEKILQQQTLYFFPFLTFIILLRLPSALALYWIVTTIFSLGQQYITLKTAK